MCITKFPLWKNSSYYENDPLIECVSNITLSDPDYDINNQIHNNYVNTTSWMMIDYSQYDFPREIWFIQNQVQVISKTATIIPVILFGIFGNILLMNIILANKPLRTATNLLIANMAAADLATILICPTMFVVHDFYQNYELGAVGCKTEGFLQGAFLITAVLNLCAVSYDRLTAIVLPRETRLTIRGAKIFMVLSWVIGFTLAIPLIIYRNYRERQWRNFVEKYCTENISILPIYWHVIISIMVWLPLAVMVFCYSAIFYKLDKYEQQVLKREHPIAISYKTKVAKMLFIIVISFVVLRVPFTALVFIRNQMLKDSVTINQVEGPFSVLWYTSHYLLYLNAAINPIIYGLTNDTFKKAYHQTPLLRCMCKNKPDINLKKQERSKRFLASLHPREPCGDQKFGGSSFWNVFQPKGREKLMSKATQSTNIEKCNKEANISLSRPSNIQTVSTIPVAL